MLWLSFRLSFRRNFDQISGVISDKCEITSVIEQICHSILPDSSTSRLPSPEEQAAHLARLAIQVMPFGQYAGRYLTDLPEAYLLWFRGKGWPAGQLGRDWPKCSRLK